jgi:hypothetical protein
MNKMIEIMMDMGFPPWWGFNCHDFMIGDGLFVDIFHRNAWALSHYIVS